VRPAVVAVSTHDAVGITGRGLHYHEPVDFEYVFAGLVVTDRDAAVRWYEKLLGAAPDFYPNDVEAVWQLTGSASLYLLADAARAGGGVVTMVVEDLEGYIGELSARGVAVGAIEEIPRAGRKVVAFDPDGNAVGVVELLSASPA
jgi:predicted enzyme related to lactoylglutathione lyase